MKTSHSITSLNVSTLKEITQVANGFQVELDVKVTKRFATKPAAIKKALILQDEFITANPDHNLVEPLDAERAIKKPTTKPAPKVAIVKPTVKPAAKPTTKPVKTTLDLDATVTTLNNNPKGTIEKAIHNAITQGYDTVESLAGEIVDTHTLARSGNKVDMKYALRNIKLFADRNSITVVSK